MKKKKILDSSGFNVIIKKKKSRVQKVVFCATACLSMLSLGTLSSIAKPVGHKIEIIEKTYRENYSNSAVMTSTFINDEKVVKAKQELAEKYRPLKKDFTEEQSKEHDREVDSILSDTTISKDDKMQKLEKLNVYQLEVDANNISSKNSSSQDISFSTPAISILYQSENEHWVLYGSGYWKSIANVEMPHVWWPVEGQHLDVGSPDKVGILLTGTYGETTGLHYVDGYGLFGRSTDGQKNENRNADIIESAHGAIFDVKDPIVIEHVDTFLGIPKEYVYRYEASFFSTQLRYSKEFENYHGNAVVFYGHTGDGDESGINSIGIQAGGFGVSVSWSNGGSKHWEAISNDRPF